MSNLIAFINSFLSYILVFGVILIVGAVALFLGISTRKSKDAKLAAIEGTQENTEE